MLKSRFANITLLFSLAIISQPLAAHDSPEAYYLANEGVLISNGDVKVIFDPLFDTSYGQYQLVPEKMEQDLFAGRPL